MQETLEKTKWETHYPPPPTRRKEKPLRCQRCCPSGLLSEHSAAKWLYSVIISRPKWARVRGKRIRGWAANFPGSVEGKWWLYPRGVEPRGVSPRLQMQREGCGPWSVGHVAIPGDSGSVSVKSVHVHISEDESSRAGEEGEEMP